MTGRDADADDAWLRAHEGHLRLGHTARAARCAFWQATCLLFRGEVPPAMGWIARGRRLLEDGEGEVVEHGWLLTLTALPMVFEGDADSALPHLTDAIEIVERFGDADLAVLASLGLGVAMMLQQRRNEAVSLLDEIMVSVQSERISPVMVGIAYCQAIDICQQVFELRRAREWTDALSRWGDSQPDLVPYRGNCLVHRCEIFQLGGAWRDALDAAQRACEWLSGPAYWDSLGSAYYQLGEIRRLRGEFAIAEEAYRKASQAGRDPEPGMSLLRLAQGPPAVAAAAIRRALGEAQHPIVRSKILPAHVEIMIATRDLDAARASVAELRRIADDLGAPYLGGLAAHAAGGVLLAEGDARKALPQLRSAHAAWRDLDAPYQAARVREMIGLACRALDDHASAGLEFEAVRLVYQELGAAPDLARLDRLTAGPQPGAAGLTAREVEVLMLVASGKSNRAIAGHLVISEKTVARHMSNIFTKLRLASRAEATAYAYEHGLV
jgi:DNA-binding NarL/FixJ family response regulator